MVNIFVNKISIIVNNNNMKNILIKLIFLFYLFFIINIGEIDSNINKRLIYSKEDIYSKEVFTIYFKNMNSKKINFLKKFKDIEIINYIIDENKYYVRNTDKLLEKITKDLNNEDKIFYEINGIKIDGITIMCSIEDLIKIENIVDIY